MQYVAALVFRETLYLRQVPADLKSSRKAIVHGIVAPWKRVHHYCVKFCGHSSVSGHFLFRFLTSVIIMVLNMLSVRYSSSLVDYCSSE